MASLRGRFCRTKLGKLIFIALLAGSVLLLINYLTGQSKYRYSEIENNSDSFKIAKGERRLSGVRGEGHRKWHHSQGKGHRRSKHRKHRIEFDDDDDIPVQVCKHPKLDLRKDTNGDAFYRMPPLKCPGRSLMFMDGRATHINETVLNNRKLQKCDYRAVKFISDDYVSYSEVHTKTEKPFGLIVKHDFFRIQCYLEEEKAKRKGRALKYYEGDSNDEQDYHADYPADYHDIVQPDFDQFVAQIYPKHEVFQRIKTRTPRKESTQMNVFIFVMDSMSHLSFQRKMPKTYNYLKKTLLSHIMNGYNIVGDATTKNLVPLLTGKTEDELPNTRRNSADSTFVDGYPLLWYNYEHSGYATLFTEDSPTLGVFNLQLNGFEHEPTDHYMRPFWMAADMSPVRHEAAQYCLGDKPNHRYPLNYVRQFFRKYKSVPKLAIMLHTELSHEDNNPAQYMDDDFIELLKYMEQHGHLDNTLLVVMGDHGARYSQLRHTTQGKLEERLPMMSLTFPQSFRTKYPDAIKHLDTNAERLTTPFDVYETLRDVLDMGRTSKPVKYTDRAVSLLKEVPLNRTCASVGIDTHWCGCLVWDDADENSREVQEAAREVLETINRATEPQRVNCSKLSLKSVESARLVIPNEEVLKFKHTVDPDHKIANFSKDASLDSFHYQITLETSPSGALYEATVQVNKQLGTYNVQLDDISRINVYGNQPFCVRDSFPALMKFCYCKGYKMPKTTVIPSI